MLVFSLDLCSVYKSLLFGYGGFLISKVKQYIVMVRNNYSMHIP